jgi:hypothetical protein
MVMLGVGVLIGVVLAVAGFYAAHRMMFAHPDEAMCSTCDKTYNTVKRSAECPHRKKCDHRWGRTRGEGCSPIYDVRYCDVCGERQVVGSNAY